MIDPTLDFDPASLDPATLMAQPVAPPPAAPAPTDPPADPAADPIGDFITSRLESTPAPDKPKEEPTPTPTTPTDKSEPTNMAKLRQLRDAAEKEREQFKTERDALAAKLADLEPRAKTYEVERESLTQKLTTLEKAAQEAQERAWRLDARERPEWRETAGKIHEVTQYLMKVAELPALTENGIRVNPVMLMDPHNTAALNETVRVLNEAGQYVEAQRLTQYHGEVNRMRSELKAIEQAAAEEAKSWHANAEASELEVLRGTRAAMAQQNPIHDTRSAEFLALPQESRDFLLSQHTEAEKAARELRAASSDPRAVLAHGYRTNLAIRLLQHAHQGAQAQAAAAQKELAEVKARLAAYEKAAGGGDAGPSGGSRTTDPDDPEEIARMLDPRNMSGYRGIL